MGGVNEERLRLLNRRLGRVVTKGVLARTDDARRIQQVQFVGRLGKAYDGKRRYQDYGRTSVAPAGAELLFVQVGGDEGHLAAIVIDDGRYRPTDLKEGEQALYTDEGDIMKWLRGNLVDWTIGTKLTVDVPEVVINAATKVTINTPLVEVPSGDVVASGVSLVNHVHPENDSGGPTEPPLAS